MSPRLSAWLAVSLLTASCTLPPAPSGPSTSSLKLVLADMPAAERQIQHLTSGSRARFTVSGPGMEAPLSLIVPLGGTGMEAKLTGIPAGPNRIIELQTLHADETPIPGGRFRTTATLQAGANTATLSAATTPRGDVFARLLASGSPLAATLDAESLQTKLQAIYRAQRVGHFGLLNGTALAERLQANGGNLQAIDDADSGLILAHATVKVTLRGLPENLPAEVWVDDPVSPKQTGLTNGQLIIDPVKPGDWHVHARAGNLSLLPVAVTAARETSVTLDFSRRAEKLAALPEARGGAAAGVLAVDGQDLLVVAGGKTRDGVEALVSSDVRGFDGSKWRSLPPMPEPASHAASFVHAGELWVLGGLDGDDQPSDTVQVFDGSAWRKEAPIPRPTVLGTGAVLHGKLLFATGVTGIRNVNGQAVYDLSGTLYQRDLAPGSDWTEGGALAAALQGAASATLDGKFYVITGQTFTQSMHKPYLGASVYDPLTGKVRAIAPIPTPRMGAMTWVHDGKIHVAGGVTPQGKALDHVEVYDPRLDRWSAQLPLPTPRAHAAAGLLSGQVLLAGGHDGHMVRDDVVPLDGVERFTP